MTSSEPGKEETLTPQRLPYSFAKRHGVVIGDIEATQVKIVHRSNFSIEILSELKRATGRKIKLDPATDEQFNALLARTYERGSEQAMAMM